MEARDMSENAGDDLNIRRFDPSTIKPHRIVVVVGKRGTGKSVLLRDLLYHARDKLDYGVAMSPTHETAEGFRAFMPQTSVYQEYSHPIVERLIEHQKNLANTRGADKLRSLFLVLDDCLYDQKVLKSKQIRELFMNGRHMRCFMMLAAQYMMDLSPALRTQVDYCICLRENIHANREKLYKFFFGIFPKYEMFSRVLDACTANYECLVIDNTVQSNNISDCIFWYKAQSSLPPFRLCREVYWKMDAQTRGERETRTGDAVIAPAPAASVCRIQRIVKKGIPGIPGI